MRHASILAVVSTVALLVGCGSASSDDAAASDSDVTTAQCPATFKLELDKPSVYKNTPTRYYDGSTLSDSEKQRVADRMKEARTFGKSSLSFALDSKSTGKCNYVSTISKAATAPHAQLRGTSAKPMIDVVYGNFHYYAFPTSYSPAGLVFDSKARAGVFAQVAASGAFSDGASLIVKIGSSGIVGSVAPPPPPANGDAIADAVAALESEDVLPGPARNDEQKISGATPLDLVKSYIKEKYAEDPELGDGYTYQSEAKGMTEDEQVAGTLTKDVALADALDTVGNWYQDDTDAQKKARLDKVKAAIEKAAAAGAIFGFDGFEQNGCAAPTAFLLVLDRDKKVGYGIDLNPCEE